ncbi:MAG: CHAT domain-containing protein [Candidatus Obscuribacterales bacterium]|nr:CHAT domain-containing protein [Candidatus Obscuribacterales bacterium]
MIKSRKQGVVGLAALLLAVGTTNGAFAQGEGLEPKPLTPIERGLATAKPQAVRKPAGSLGAARLQEVKPEQVREVLKYAELPQTPENEDKIRKLDKDAEDLFRAGRVNDALLRWQEAYGLSIEMKYSVGQGRALTGLCKVYLTQGKWVKARHLGENAVEVLSGINDQTNLGRARVALAQAYFGLDNPVWAIKQLELAMKHLLDQPKTDPAEAGNLMRLAGGLLLQGGKVVEAVRFLQESARYSEEAKDFPGALMMRTRLASLMDEVGFYVAAKEEAEKAVALAKRTENDRAMISALSSLANTEYVLGEYCEAAASYQHAYNLAGKMDEKVLGKDGRSNLLMGYAFTLIATGESERAEKLLEGVVPYFERESKHYQHTECLNAIGLLVYNRGEPYKALPYFQRALDSQNMIKPVQPKMQYMLYQNIAASEFAGGKYREAAAHLRSILPVLDKEKTGKNSAPLIKLHTLVSLAECSLKMSEPDKAKELADQALILGKQYSDDAALWRIYTIQAQLDLTARDNEKAKSALENALSHFRSPQAGNFPSVEHLQFVSSRKSLGQQLIALVASQGMTEKALLAAEQLKEEQIIQTWVRKGVPVKPEDKDVYIDLVNQRAHLHAAENTSTPEKLTKEWAGWLARFSDLAQRNKSLARLVQPYPTSVEDIINGVRKKKVTVVEYLVGDKSSVAFTIDPIGRISATVLPVGQEKLAGQIATVLNNSGAELAGGESEGADRAVLQALYKELLPASVLNFLPSTADKQIVIVPDSVLFNLPFAALIDEQGKYFVENHLVSLATSIGVVLDGQVPTGNKMSVLVALNSNPEEQSQSSQILSAVDPEPVSTLSVQSTDLQELQRVSQDKTVLHVASAIPLTGENPIKNKLPFAAGEATKDNTTGGLFQLTMPNELVVLSGTSISGNDQTGKAVQVVSRGLGYAGAGNVMMTLWNEPSDTKNTEIGNFYKNKKRGMNDAQSLRQAQLLAISADRNPKAWAAFQLLGAGM